MGVELVYGTFSVEVISEDDPVHITLVYRGIYKFGQSENLTFHPKDPVTWFSEQLPLQILLDSPFTTSSVSLEGKYCLQQPYDEGVFTVRLVE